MERRFAVHAGSQRQALIALAIALASGTASAAPHGGDAKVQFDRGLAAYQKGDYAAASTAFGASFDLESDAETLFAWAQAERKLDHCEKASELYGKLLAMDLPAENKRAVTDALAECRKIIAGRQPPEPVKPDKTESAAAAATPSEPTTEPATPAPVTPEARAWWRDPVGGALVGGGVVGVGLGVALLVSAHSADADKPGAASYADYKALDDRARLYGTLGVVATVLGGASIAGGIAWYVMHRPAADHAQLTGWLSAGSGGLAVAGWF